MSCRSRHPHLVTLGAIPSHQKDWRDGKPCSLDSHFKAPNRRTWPADPLTADLKKSVRVREAALTPQPRQKPAEEPPLGVFQTKAKTSQAHSTRHDMLRCLRRGPHRPHRKSCMHNVGICTSYVSDAAARTTGLSHMSCPNARLTGRVLNGTRRNCRAFSIL